MADTSVPITAGSGTNIDAQSVSGGDLQQTVTLGDGTNAGRVAKLGAGGDQLVSITNPNSALAGLYATLGPTGDLNVQVDGVLLFYDTFEGSTVDVTNRWVATGTVPATQVSGSASFNPSTTASATSVLSSVPTFTHAAEIDFGTIITIEAAVTLGNHRFWGLGTSSGVGTSAAPVLDGLGFEVDTAGALRASIYTAGTRTFTQTLTRPTDGLSHRYSMTSRGDIAFWFMDTFDVPAAFSQVTPGSQLLPLRLASLNSASVTVSTPTMVCAGVALYDQGRNAQGIADGTYPWRRATVGKNGGLSVKASAIAGQSLAVTASTPTTGTGLDVSEAGALTFIVKNTVAATAFTGVPVMTFEQSDDNVSWAPLPVTTNTGLVTATPTMTAGTANVSQMFDAALEGVNWVRVRVTTAQTANGMTVVTQPGGGFFSPSVAIGASVSAGALTTSVSGLVNLNPTPGFTIGTAAGTNFQARAAVTTATTAVLVAAPAGGLALYITDISVSNSGTTLSTVSLLPTAGTSLIDIVAAASGGGGSMNFRQPLRVTTATGLSYTTSAASTSVFITVTGFTAS